MTMTTPIGGWLAPATALWVIVAAVALGATTSIPIHLSAIAMLIAAIAVGNGLLRRKWLISGVCAALGLAAAIAFLVLDSVAGIDAVYTGPLGESAPKAIWTALAVIIAAEIVWGLLLRARYHRAPDSRVDQLADEVRYYQVSTRAHLAEASQRMNTVEKLLTEPG